IHIDHYFKLGGFGSDNIDRTELVKIAVKKAIDDFNFNGITFVIGDTPRDIKAGFEADAKTIAVATGTYTKVELKEFNPDFVFESLNEKEEISKVILG
ncbi:MAG: HAD hydrolase-like protein, partial [Methanobacterium sp.]